MLSSASGPIQKAGKAERLFSRRGGVTIYERGGCKPPAPPPWIHLCSVIYDSAEHTLVLFTSSLLEGALVSFGLACSLTVGAVSGSMWY